MEYVVTAEEMRRADENTILRFGVPGLVLMERAALSARDAIARRWPELFEGESRILIALGNGNNGGDGAALARLFFLMGQRVTVLVNKDARNISPALRTQMEILEQYRGTPSGSLGLSVAGDGELARREGQYDLVVDALFGVGLSRPVEGACRETIEWLNGLSGKKAALDIPSGVSAHDGRVLGCAFRADLTVTFGFVKRGMLLYPGRELCGEVEVADIGIAEESFLGSPPAGITLGRKRGKGLGAKAETRGNSPQFRRTPDSHKGTYGKVLIFAGSKDAPGAALLAGEAVLRSGAGMLQLVASAENRDLVMQKLPEAMYRTLDSRTDWEGPLDWCDAVAAGPGIGQGEIALENLRNLLATVSEDGRGKPVVLDADGLNLAASDESILRLIRAYAAGGGIVIMTPHMAEFARLLRCSVSALREERLERAERFVREHGVVLVLKDAATLVCYVDEAGVFRYYVNQTGNSGMASAGSGDVLTGMTGAFAAYAAARLRSFAAGPDGILKRRSERAAYFEAAYRAVYLHGLAGDLAALKYGETAMKAGDIIAELPGLFREDAQGVDSTNLHMKEHWL